MLTISTHGKKEGSTHITTKIHQSATHAERKSNYISDLNLNNKISKTCGLDHVHCEHAARKLLVRLVTQGEASSQ
jgi:hypothetical protein